MDPWTLLVWRGVFGGLFIAACVAWRHGRASLALLRAAGLPGLAAAACSTLGTICFLHALRLTSVADVTIIYATAPFVATGIAWLRLRERPGRATLCAAGLALGGLLVMTGGTAGSGRLAGNALALGMTVLIAAMVVIIRHHRALPMLPAASLSAFACVALAPPFADRFRVTLPEFLGLAAFGAVQFGLGLLLLTLGSRLLPGPRAALLGNVELPLAPLWVWLAFGSVPPEGIWIGGAIVALALALDLVAGQRARRRDAAMAPPHPPASAPGVTPSAARKAAPKAGALA